MTSRLFKQTLQLALDKDLQPYWISRALIASLFFLFGILLRNIGLVNEKVIVAWIVVSVAQAATLLSLDWIARKYHPRVHWRITQIMALVALASATIMIFTGLHLVWFSVATISMLPLIREATHTGMIHIRDRKDWVLGNNVSFLYANEASKGLGAVFIVVLGYLSSIGSETVAAFLSVLLIICIKQSLSKNSGPGRELYDPSERIGAAGKRYVLISFIHNGAFSGSKYIMSLVLFDLVSKSSGVENVIIVIAGGLSITMVLGIVIMQALRHRIEALVRTLPRVSLMTLALAGLTSLVALGAALTSLSFVPGVEASYLGYGIAFVIAALMAFGGLFSLGTMKFLDRIFAKAPDLRKSTLHYCWIGSSFSPAIFMGAYLVLEWFLPSLVAGAWILGIILIAEIFITAFAHDTSKMAPHNDDATKELP